MAIQTEHSLQLGVEIKKKLKEFDLDISFSAGKGCLGILGPSGCGKSMTLKSIAGIVTPDSGRIALQYAKGEAAGGRVLYDSALKINEKPQMRRVGYLFQNYALFPNMTVRENIAFAFGKEKEKDFLEELLERFYLTEVAELYPSVLSGGQQQRTAMARMLAAKPDVILLDEPFSALDSFLQQEMEREVQQVLQSFGGVSILVSHNKEEIFRLTQKCMVMERGKIAEIGDTKEIFAHPKTAEGRLLIQGGSL